jgi:uncharacterized protein (TIGR02284 family)
VVPVADDTTRIASTITELIRRSKDSEQGFESAARLVEDLNLRHLFESYARQRAEFAAELEAEMGRLSPDALDAHLGGELLRSGTDAGSDLSPKEDCGIITDCERHEDRTAAAFQEAIGAGLPEHLRLMVERQLGQIKEALQHVRSLERAHSRMQ